MKWKRILFLLILWTVFNHVNLALYQSEASSVRNSDLKSWFKLFIRWMPIKATPNNNIRHETPFIESSFTQEDEVRPSSHFHLRQIIITDDYDPYNNGDCTCSSTDSCSTTCTSLEIQCDKTCTITTEFYASITTYSTSPIDGYELETSETITNYSTYSTGCEEVTTECINLYGTKTTYPGNINTTAVEEEFESSFTVVGTEVISEVIIEVIKVTETTYPELSTDAVVAEIEEIGDPVIADIVAIADIVNEVIAEAIEITGTVEVISGTTEVAPGSTVVAEISFVRLAAVAVAAAVAIAVGIAVPLGTPLALPPPAIPDSFVLFNNPMPVNLNPPPGNLPDDGCGTSSGRFRGGQFDGRNSTQIINRRNPTQINRKTRIKRQQKLRQENGCNHTLNFNNNNNNCTNNCTHQKDENACKKELENDENWNRIHGTWKFTDSRNNCIRFGGECHQLLSSEPCRNPRQWFTLDPMTLKGRCSPCLCGRGRVFVGETGLCHDSEDPGICSGGRKLFYTAYGDPICDCPVGEYPFPGEKSNCVTLFTRGPCPLGQVVAFSQSGTLQCMTSICKSNANDLIPFSPYEDGLCYALGSQGPCRRQPFQLFGYNVFERRAVCVNVTAIGSPYFELDEDIDELNINYNQLSPEYDNFRFLFTRDSAKNSAGKRQGDALLTAGLFQLPANFPKDPLLNACRPGARNGNNYKCTNPVVFLGKKKRLLQAVRSSFECPNDSVLQATGKCGNDTRSASCGPSYQYVESIGECRAIFQSASPNSSNYIDNYTHQ